MPKERRYDIATAQAMAIVLIVQYHMLGASFQGSMRLLMPLSCARVPFFVFVAGYFNAAKSMAEPVGFAKDRARKLMLPLYGKTLLYAAIVTVLHGLGIPRGAVSLYSVLLDPLLGGHALFYNLPMWFIAPLFFVEVIYAFLARIMRGGRLLDCCLMVASLAVAAYCGADGVSAGLLCLVLRTIHFLGWYALGRVWRERLEGMLARVPLWSCFAAYAVAFFVVDMVTKGACSSTVSWLQFDAGALSVAVALDGVFGLMLLGRALEPVARRSQLVTTVSQNTFAIMCHHLFGMFLAMSALALASSLTPWFNSFDAQAYLATFGYVWFPNGLAEFAWVYVAFGIAFAIWFQRMIDRGAAAAQLIVQGRRDVGRK